MIRVLCVTTLICAMLVFGHLAAQDPASVVPRPTDSNSASQPDRASNLKAAQERSDEMIREAPVPANDRSREMIEQELKRTNTIKIQFQGHQVIIPLMDDVPVSDSASVLVKWLESQPETTLGKGKHSLIVSPQPATAIRLVKLLANVLYIDKGERREVANVPISSLLHGHNPGLKLTKPEKETLERVLGRAKHVTFMLGLRNILVTMSNEAPKARLATAIVDLAKKDQQIGLLDDPEHLIIKVPVAKLEHIVDAVVGTLAASMEDPLAAPAKPSSDEAGKTTLKPGVQDPGNPTGTLSDDQSPLPREAIPSKHYNATPHIIIAVAENGDRAWGYSKTLGKWTTLKFEKPLPLHFPRVVGHVGYIEIYATEENIAEGRPIWAYSGVTGTWDTLKLPAGSKALPSNGNESVIVRDRSRMHIFSSQTGKWSAPPAPDDETAPAVATKQGAADPNATADGIPSLKIFALKHMSADVAASLLKQLYRDTQIRFVADMRTNSLISQANVKDHGVIEALLMRLDSEPTRTKAAPETSSTQTTASPEQQAKLKALYESAEREAAQLARKITGSENITDLQRAELKKAVTAAFDRRQDLHRAELAAFQQRMEKVQQTLQTRDKFKTEIIDRRVADLLNPNLKWDAANSPTARPDGAPSDKTRSARVHLENAGPNNLSPDPNLVQFKISGPPQATVKVQDDPRNYPLVGIARLTQELELPGRLNLPIGKADGTLNLTGNQGVLDYPFSLEIPTPADSAATYLQHNSLPLIFTDEDLDQLRSGNLVTKVIYLPNAAHQEAKVPAVEVIVSTRLDPGLDPVSEAQKRGIVLATLRMSSSSGKPIGGNQVPAQTQSTSGQPASTKPDNAMPLSVAVKKFNDLLKTDPTLGDIQPVTEDEVVAAFRWIASSPRPSRFSEAERKDLLHFSETRFIPARWSLVHLKARSFGALTQGAGAELGARPKSELPVKDPQLFIETIAMNRGSPADLASHVAIRSRFDRILSPDGQPYQFPELDPVNAPLFGAPLGDAIRELNATNPTITARTQPPLTEQEVIGGILDWKYYRGDSKLSDEELAVFDAIASHRHLPAGFRLEAVTRKFLHTNYSFQTVSVSVVMGDREPTKTNPSRSFGFAIRTRFLDSAPIHREAAEEATVGKDAKLPAVSDESLLWETLGVKVKQIEPRNFPPLNGRFSGGLRVVDVRAGGPFARTDTKVDDILVGFDTWVTESVHDLVFALKNHSIVNPKQQPCSARFYLQRQDRTLSGDVTYPRIIDGRSHSSPPPVRYATFQFGFADTPWQSFLNWLQASTKRTLDMEVIPEGTFSYATQRPLYLDEVIQVVNEKLAPQGIVVSVNDDFLMVAKQRRPAAQTPTAVQDLDAKRKTVDRLHAIHRALRRYYDQHQHFPPAVILGKDGKGKEPHSWRVELLPYLGKRDLYESYHFDEPWDSDHNKSLIPQMPEVYRSPLDRVDSPNASYFGVVTPGLQVTPVLPAGAAAATGTAVPFGYYLGTFFSNPAGTKIYDVSDGTSNSICIVEAKRQIAWTKPEDIPLYADKPLATLGEWFPEGWHAAFVDGEVKFIAKANPESAIRALLTISGGEVINPNFVPDRTADGQGKE